MSSADPARSTTRGTIFLEDARVLDQKAFDGEQYVIRVEAPRCAAHAEPGSFAHISCDPTIPMRRPLSIMRVDPRAGWIEMLYKVVGNGLHALSARKAGDVVSVLGPIGHGFTLHPDKPRTLLIGGGVGIPPMIFLAERLKESGSPQSPGGSEAEVDRAAPEIDGAGQGKDVAVKGRNVVPVRDDAGRPAVNWKPLVLMGSEIPFPFRTRPSQILVPGIPAGSIACMPMLDEWGIPSRLASKSDFPGCFDGFVTELADAWLSSLGPPELAEVEIFACGPTPMLQATAQLARKHGVACQVSLEEFMACAVGGCAGCTVLVQTPDGPAMKRVCVDGPVFDAQAVFA